MLKTPKNILLLLISCISLPLLGQGPSDKELSLFLSDSLPMRDESGNLLADPFTGGIESPKFFKLELNGDAKEDLIVFDRKNNKISTYINNGSAGNAVYRHSPEFEGLFPKGRYSYYIVDVDRDGHMDIICGNPIQNRLDFYLNKGTAAPDLTFQNRGQINFLHYTPPSPGVKNSFGNPIQHIQAVEDVDGDGDIDIITLGPFGGSLQYFVNHQADSSLPKDSLDFHLGELCFGYFNEALANQVTLGTCTGPKYYTRRHTGGTSLLLLDLNKDGDKDILMGNNGFDNLVMLENGYSDYTTSYDSIIAWDSIFPRNTLQAKIHTYPSASYVDITGDGINDLVVAPTWNTDFTTKGLNQTMLYSNSGQNDSPIFNYVGNNFLMNSSIDLGENCSPAFWDYDSDGDMDLFIAFSGDAEKNFLARDKVALFKNIGTKTKPELQFIDTNYGNFASLGLRYSRLAIYDLDKDGKPEFYFGQQDGFVIQCTNNGTSLSPNFVKTSSNLIGLQAQFGYAAPAFWDYDKDGATDVILGSYSGNLSYYKNTGTNAAPVFTWQMDQMGKMFTNEFTYRTAPPSYESIGASTPIIADLNGDNKVEVIAGSLHGGLYAWIPTNNPQDSFAQYENFMKYLDYKGDTQTNYYFGRNIAVAAADLDGDTIQDLIVTTDAGGIFYLSGKARKFEVSVQDLKTFHLDVYPNPTQGKVGIQNMPQGSKKQLTLVDPQGKLILQQETKLGTDQIDLTAIPLGIYILRIQADGYNDFVYRISKL